MRRAAPAPGRPAALAAIIAAIAASATEPQDGQPAGTAPFPPDTAVPTRKDPAVSNWHYLACLSHDPPLPAGQEVSQHADDRVEAARRLLHGWHDAGRPALTGTAAPTWAGPLYGSELAAFLETHPRCAIGIRSDGDTEPVIPELRP